MSRGNQFLIVNQTILIEEIRDPIELNRGVAHHSLFQLAIIFLKEM